MHFSPLVCFAPLLLSAVSVSAKLSHKRGTCSGPKRQSSTSSSATSGAAVVAAAQRTRSGTAASAAATGSSSSSGLGQIAGPARANIVFGVLPDDGSGGGTAHSVQELKTAMGYDGALPQGWYAQAHSGTPFDGGQLLSRKDTIVKQGGVFQPAIMPIGGWGGLKHSDNSQAVRICKVLKEFTDAGMPVWLRFAHEINWYLQDGTYSGTKEDFKEGWDVVAKTCKQIAPEVKMWFTPNVAALSVYDEFYPDDASTVDIIGIDFYPHQAPTPQVFLTNMKPFHDKYTSDKVHFAIGETGHAACGSLDNQLNWLKAIMSDEVAKGMPNLKQVSWFNYDKECDFRILGKWGDSATKSFLFQ